MSTAIASYSYDEKTQTLYILMEYNPPRHRGELLAYKGVSKATYEQFNKAESKGAFFNSRIRAIYPLVN